MSDTPLDIDDLKPTVNFLHNINASPSGAIANWNGLISRARGRYIWLLHHDEEPVFTHGLDAFLDSLEHHEPRDCLISHLNLRDRWWQRAIRTDAARKILVKRPISILFQNYVGSPSNVIVHCSKRTAFTQTLTWFVDIEWYYRLFSQSKKITFSEFEIITHPYTGSITESLGKGTGGLALSEAKLICREHHLSPVLKWLWIGKLKVVRWVKT